MKNLTKIKVSLQPYLKKIEASKQLVAPSKNLDNIHLLGCNIPQEFSWYKDMPFIKTIDTSNPVIHGLAGIKYEPWGLNNKLSTKVDKFEGEAKHWDTAIYNIQTFKTFLPK